MISKTPDNLIAEGTINAAGATTRGVHDLRESYGGILTIKITNGATGPTTQAVANVLIAHFADDPPEPGPAGSDWKTLHSFGNGVLANTSREWAVPIDPAICHLEVEITGNTAQPVTCEAFITRIDALN